MILSRVQFSTIMSVQFFALWSFSAQVYKYRRKIILLNTHHSYPKVNGVIEFL